MFQLEFYNITSAKKNSVYAISNFVKCKVENAVMLALLYYLALIFLRKVLLFSPIFYYPDRFFLINSIINVYAN